MRPSVITAGPYRAESSVQQVPVCGLLQPAVPTGAMEGKPKEVSLSPRLQLHKAAKQDDTQAQYNPGCLYRIGRGTPQDVKEAIRWFYMAAKQGDP